METTASATTASSGGSSTVVVSEAVLCHETTQKPVLVLRLGSREKPKVTWEEGTIDNEHLCKKSSKRKSIIDYLESIYIVNFLFFKLFLYTIYLCLSPNLSSLLGCCIFHKLRDVCESDSDESDSDIEEAEKADNNPEKVKPFQIHHA